MSQHRHLYSVRMYYSNSMESLDVPMMVHPRPNYCKLGAPALLIQDQGENCCKSDKLDDLNNQKLLLERKIANLKQYQNLNKEDLVLSLNQIEQSIGIIFLSTPPNANNLESHPLSNTKSTESKSKYIHILTSIEAEISKTTKEHAKLTSLQTELDKYKHAESQMEILKVSANFTSLIGSPGSSKTDKPA